MPKMDKPWSAPKSAIQDFIDKLAITTPPHVVRNYKEIKKADIVVCMLASIDLGLRDNVFDFCADCDEEIQLRPHVPKGPDRVCYKCAETRISKSGRKNIRIAISKKTAEEIKKYQGRK